MRMPPAPLHREPVVRATAATLPDNVVSNQDIVDRLIAGSDSSLSAVELEQLRSRAGTIERKTGLRERRFFAPTQDPSDVALEALTRLVERANTPWSELDAILVSSSSIHGFPGQSQMLVAKARERHPELGQPFVLDIGSNACTSFMYSLGIASSLLQTHHYRNIACLAVEFSSRCIDYSASAFGTSTLFGDAVAGILIASEGSSQARVASTRMVSVIDATAIRHVRGGGLMASDWSIPTPNSERWYMSGPPVALAAIDILVSEVRRYLDAGIHVDWLIPHQANLTRILLPACELLGIPRGRLCTSFAHTGNTSSASIPLLLDELLSTKLPRAGENVILVGFGASFSVSSAHLVVT